MNLHDRDMANINFRPSRTDREEDQDDFGVPPPSGARLAPNALRTTGRVLSRQQNGGDLVLLKITGSPIKGFNPCGFEPWR
jgi:hypothetical protein